MMARKELRTDLINGSTKEKDNRWLQLPICNSLIDHIECPNQDCPQAHPPLNVLNYNRLKNGNVVCCQDYIFRDSQVSSRKISGVKGCIRGSECRYYHPSKTQEALVKKAGKINQEIKAIYSSQLQLELQKQKQWVNNNLSINPYVPFINYPTSSSNNMIVPGGGWMIPANPLSGLPQFQTMGNNDKDVSSKVMQDIVQQQQQQQILVAQYYQQCYQNNLAMMQLQQQLGGNLQMSNSESPKTYQQGFQPYNPSNIN